jgi:signal recognition particle subunit SEC65/uncharacterized protein YdaU (DUF1376 family)
MTFEEKGAYIDLLMLQFNRGHMDGHMVAQVVGQLWGRIQDKFMVDQDGLFYNERLDEEIAKRKAFTESRCNNLLGKNQYTNKEAHLGAHKSSRTEDVNEDVDVSIDVVGGVGGENKKLDAESNGKIDISMFENFWILYPRKIAKKRASDSWKKLCKESLKEKPTWKEISMAIRKQVITNQLGEEEQYIPHPATWLNGKRWKDEIKILKNGKSGKRQQRATDKEILHAVIKNFAVDYTPNSRVLDEKYGED